MSEERDLNPSSSPDPARAEMESLLRELIPQPLGLNRDVLFFEAGKLAANRVQNRQRVWPAVAAILLVACGGLSFALARKSTALEAALTVSAARPTAGVVSVVRPTGQGADGLKPTVSEPALLTDSARRGGRRSSPDIDEMLLLDRPRGDQLTAQGWVTGPVQNATTEDPQPASPEESPLRPSRRGDEWELIHGLGG
jgi:hypothetical protein